MRKSRVLRLWSNVLIWGIREEGPSNALYAWRHQVNTAFKHEDSRLDVFNVSSRTLTVRD